MDWHVFYRSSVYRQCSQTDDYILLSYNTFLLAIGKFHTSYYKQSFYVKRYFKYHNYLQCLGKKTKN